MKVGGHVTAAILALLCLDLVPLPPAIWYALPGREIMVEIDEAARLGQVWLPLTMSPSSTWNAFMRSLSRLPC